MRGSSVLVQEAVRERVADELVLAAGELEADLVVVGRRGGGTSRHEPGSVSAAVVRLAPCDVLVVG